MTLKLLRHPVPRRLIRSLIGWVLSAFAMMAAPAWAVSGLVASGQGIYQQSPGLAPMSLKQAAAPASPILGNACSNCHFPGVAPGSDGQGSNHPLAANNTSRMQAAFGTGGRMLAQIGAAAVPSPTNAQLDAYFNRGDSAGYRATSTAPTDTATG